MSLFAAAVDRAVTFWPDVGIRSRLPSVPCCMTDGELLALLQVEMGGSGTAWKTLPGHPGFSVRWWGGWPTPEPGMALRGGLGGEERVEGTEFLDLVRRERKISRPEGPSPAHAEPFQGGLF